MIKICQGGYAIAKKDEDINLITYELLECPAMLVDDTKKVGLFHIDFYTSSQQILNILQNEFNDQNNLQVSILFNANTHQLGEESVKVQQDNLLSIQNALKAFQTSTGKKISCKVSEGNCNSKSGLMNVGFSVKGNSFLDVSAAIGLFAQDTHKVLSELCKDPFYCMQAMTSMFRAGGGLASPPLVNCRDFNLPLNPNILKAMSSFFTFDVRLIVKGVGLDVEEATGVDNNKKFAAMYVYKLYCQQLSLFGSLISDTCKEQDKYVDPDNLNDIKHFFVAWYMSSNIGYKLMSTEQEKSTLIFFKKTLGEYLSNSIKKKTSKENFLQIFKFSNLFCGCASFYFDLQHLAKTLPTVEQIIADQNQMGTTKKNR